MKFVFFCTNSNFFTPDEINVSYIPECKTEWLKFSQKFNEHTFFIVMQKPGLFLLDKNDLNSEKSVIEISKNLKIIFLPEDAQTENFVKEIQKLNPDMASSITYWISPFDWLSIKDSLIAEKLMQQGIKTFSHPAKTSQICFDKRETRDFLTQNSFPCAEGFYVHHEMFFAERRFLSIKENVYKEYVFEKLKNMNFPVVIKDTLGLSSFGMDVCKTFQEAKHVLLSKKNNGDRVIEEFISGLSFGLEIYGHNGNYLFSPLFINSLNQFGLTSPKQNVKLGPVTNEKFHIKSLHEMLYSLSKKLNFSGIAQIDLVFSGGKWYIIEINSRLSGMTQTVASSLGISLYELVFYATVGFDSYSKKLSFLIENSSFTFNMKFPLLQKEKLEKLYDYEFVDFVNQIENTKAKQLREAGYAEVIFGREKSLKKLLEKLETIKNDFKTEIEQRFYENAILLAKEIS